MRWKLQTEGGFAHVPGLAGPFEVDEADLGPVEAARLKGRVAAARFFDLPEEIPPAGEAAGARDVRRHTITVEEGGRSRTVRVTEPVEDPDLWELVYEIGAAVEKRAGAGR